jgi:hypothetical protein
MCPLYELEGHDLGTVSFQRFLQLAGEFVGRVASTVCFTTLAALVSALSSPFSMVGSPTAMSPAWLAVSC